MRHRSGRDQLQKTLDSIYEAAVTPARWDGTINALADFCGLGVGSLVVVDPSLEMTRVRAPRADPRVVAEYDTYWWAKDPSIDNTRDLPVGQIHVMNPEQRRSFLSSQYHNEFWRHSDMGSERICTNLLTFGQGSFANLTLLASRKNDVISSDSHENFSHLVPHLVRAMGISRDLQMLTLTRRAAECRLEEQALFAIPVDRFGRPIGEAEEAEHALRSFPFLRLVGGVLSLSDKQAADRLARLIHQCAEPSGEPPGGIVSLPAVDNESGFTIKIIPFRIGDRATNRVLLTEPAALLLISPESAPLRSNPPQTLQEKYHLTPAETRVALELLNGGGREAVAKRLDISVATVRTHLSRIFEKTHVRRQSELVALILSL